MKKLFTILSLLAAGQLTMAGAATDTVSVAAGYANQVWYSLPNDEQGNAPKDNWDIAFEASGFSASILANTQKGLVAYQSPYAIAQWSTVDTAGIANWPSLHNSDIDWEGGALNTNPDGNTDLGWGEYNMNTHAVNGDSIFVVQLLSGAWKKLRINSLTSGTYSFTYANLDGSNEQTATLAKSDYSGKNFAYYSLEGNTALDREPATSTWDVTFTKYITTIMAPAPTPYGVTGVLLNKNVLAVKASTVDVDTVDYNNYTFQSDINTIGYDWKAFAGSWVIEDSLVYFIQRSNGDIWKVIFTGFGGSTSGNYIFTKEQVYTAPTVSGINHIEEVAVLSIYPNPTREQFQVIYTANTEAVNTIKVFDLAGRVAYEESFNANAGLNQQAINIAGLTKGIYLVGVSGTDKLQKLIVE